MDKYYEEMLEQGEKDYPELERRSCSRCGQELVKGSYNYNMGEHVDGCPEY